MKVAVSVGLAIIVVALALIVAEPNLFDTVTQRLSDAG